MNICFCSYPISNCENIDEILYVCQKCGKHIVPFRFYSYSDNNRTPFTFKSIFYIVLDIFRPKFN